MTAKLKVLTAAAVLAFAGVASWALLPRGEVAGAPRDARAHEGAAAPGENGMALAPVPRGPASPELGAERTRVGDEGPGAPRRAPGPGLVVVGDVSDGEGHAIDGASVWMRSARGEERTATTQDGLGFVFARLTPGEWDIGCRAPRYRELVRKVT